MQDLKMQDLKMQDLKLQVQYSVKVVYRVKSQSMLHQLYFVYQTNAHMSYFTILE